MASRFRYHNGVKMPKEKKECPYEQVTGKIDIIDKKLEETSEKLKKLCG